MSSFGGSFNSNNPYEGFLKPGSMDPLTPAEEIIADELVHQHFGTVCDSATTPWNRRLTMYERLAQRFGPSSYGPAISYTTAISYDPPTTYAPPTSHTPPTFYDPASSYDPPPYYAPPTFYDPATSYDPATPYDPATSYAPAMSYTSATSQAAETQTSTHRTASIGLAVKNDNNFTGPAASHQCAILQRLTSRKDDKGDQTMDSNDTELDNVLKYYTSKTDQLQIANVASDRSRTTQSNNLSLSPRPINGETLDEFSNGTEHTQDAGEHSEEDSDPDRGSDHELP